MAGWSLRYGVGLWLASRLGPGFPWGTFFVNVTGSFVIGVVLAMVASGQLSSEARLFLAVDRREKIEAILPKVEQMVERGLVTIEEVKVVMSKPIGL